MKDGYQTGGGTERRQPECPISLRVARLFSPVLSGPRGAGGRCPRSVERGAKTKIRKSRRDSKRKRRGCSPSADAGRPDSSLRTRGPPDRRRPKTGCRKRADVLSIFHSSTRRLVLERLRENAEGVARWAVGTSAQGGAVRRPVRTACAPRSPSRTYEHVYPPIRETSHHEFYAALGVGQTHEACGLFVRSVDPSRRRRAVRFRGPAAASTAGEAQHKAGGEANLILPDLSQAQFLGMSGSALLMWAFSSPSWVSFSGS